MGPSSTNDYVRLGILRGIAGFPFEHPLEVSKLKNQASPGSSSRRIIRTLFMEQGFKGFYQGAAPSLTKRCVKEAYRWPTIAFLHSFWDATLPPSIKFEGMGTNIATAGSIAGMETCIILPLERLLVTKVNEEGYRAFFARQFKQEGMAAFYPGVSITFVRHITVWTTFMAANHVIKRKVHRLDPQQQYPRVGMLFANVLIAANLTLWGSPLDFTKVQIQMHPEFQRMRIHQVMRTLLQTHGVKGFYAGASFTFLHANIHALLGGALFDKITQGKSHKD